MTVTAKAGEVPIEALPVDERIRRRAYELYVERGNELAPNSMIGSRPKKKCFSLRNSHRQRTGARNARMGLALVNNWKLLPNAGVPAKTLTLSVPP